jgi:hypothetical protein
LRIRDVYPRSRIPEPDFYPSRIPDPTTVTKEEGKKFVVLPFLVATNYEKMSNKFISNRYRNKFEPIHKEL